MRVRSLCACAALGLFALPCGAQPSAPTPAPPDSPTPAKAAPATGDAPAQAPASAAEPPLVLDEAADADVTGEEALDFPGSPLSEEAADDQLGVISAEETKPKRKATRKSKVLSRGSAIAMAVTQNPQAAAARAAVAQARARQGQVAAARFPEVELTLGVGPSLQAELVPGTALLSTRNAYSDVRLSDLSVVLGGQLSVIQPLYTFGKIDERDEATTHEIRAREEQAKMTKADIAFKVAELYETLLLARDSELFLDEMMHGLQRTLDRTKREIEEGRMIEQDLLRLQTAIGYLSIVYHQARAGVIQATAGLVAYLGLPKGTPIETKDEHLELIALDEQLDDEELLRVALVHRPELRALRAGQAAFNHLAEAEAAGSLPDFFAAAFVSGAYTPGRDWVGTRFAIDPLNHFVPGGLLGMRWKFQGDMASERANEVRAKALELAQLERWAETGLPAEITLAVEDIRRTRADVESTQVAVSRAKKWTIQASADFAIGLGRSQEVEDASAAYVQLRLANFRARYQYNVAVASLAKAMGLLTTPHVSAPYPTKD